MIHKEIEREIALSGQSESVEALKKKQNNFKRNKKPIITLLVVILGSAFIDLLFTVIYMIRRLIVDFKLYHDFMENVVFHNVNLFVLFFQPLIYGLYFKQVCQSMMKQLKRFLNMNKFNSIAPQP